MAKPSVPKALLIDLDNCPRQLEHLPQTLAGYTRIIACYGGVEPKVALGLVPLLAGAIQEKKLEIVGMKRPGKNAADFGLAFWAGRLVAELPSQTEFHILSQDADLDQVADLLRSAARVVKRMDGRAPVAKPIPAGPDPGDLSEYRARLLDPAYCHPGKRSSLTRSIRAYFKGRKQVDPQAMLARLVAEGSVRIDQQGRVSYPEPSDELPF